MENILKLVSIFRVAMDTAKKEGKFIRDQRFNRFPTGCCGITTELIGKFLRDNGISDTFTYVSASYYDYELENPPHAWLLINEKIVVDITGDQFKNYPDPLKFDEPVYVGPYNFFYNMFEEISRYNMGECKLDNHKYRCYMSTEELYDMACDIIIRDRLLQKH